MTKHEARANRLTALYVLLHCASPMAMVAAFTQPPSSLATEVASGLSLSAINTAWLGRQKATPSFTISWRTKMFLVKGGLMGTGISPIPVPPGDMEVAYNRSLLVNSGRMRYMNCGDFWDGRAAMFAPGEALHVWNGKEGRGFLRMPGVAPDGNDFAEGGIWRKGSRVVDASAVPAVLAIHPLNATLGGISLASYELADQLVETNKRLCVVLLEKTGSTFRTEVWVDPERGFLVTRVVSRKSGVACNQLDIQYQRGARCPWIPSTWQRVTKDRNGKTRTSAKSRVTTFAIDPTATSTDFTLEFPSGSLFYDFRGKKETRHIVRHDGTARRVLDEEFYGNVPRERLMDTEPGQTMPHANASPER